MKQTIDYWLRFHAGDLSSETVILDFLCKKQSIEVLTESSIPLSQQLSIVRKFLDALLKFPLKRLPILLQRIGCLECVSPANIPQFSNFSSALIYLPKLLNDKRESMSYQEAGYALHFDCASDTAAKKYGENHLKLAAACGLVSLTEKDGYAAGKISLLGSVYCSFDSEEKIEILQRLCYRIPMIQKAVISEDADKSIENSLLSLSESTRKRRRHNAYELLEFSLNR